jgi:hypothetical protein
MGRPLYYAEVARSLDPFCRRYSLFTALNAPSGYKYDREKAEMALGDASVDGRKSRANSFYASGCSRLYYLIGERIGMTDGTFIR